jgi:hypothetical protein
MQTAAGSFLMGSPYQQALIDQSVRPIARQLGEVTLPGIQSAFSAAGRYGSGAQQRAIEGAVEAASRAAGDVATNIGFGTYGQERGFQEAARQQLAGLSQQDLANRLAAVGAGEQTRQAQIAQRAGLAAQTTGIQAQNIATQLGAAQTAEQIRQAQLGQQAGLAGQIAGLSGQNISTQLAGASGLQSAQQAAFGRQMQAAGGLGAAQEAELARGLTGAQLAPQMFAQQFLPSQQLGQIGAAREQIAGLPLQEQMARFQFGQQVPYQQLQGFLSSVYGTPMATSNVPQAQVNRVGQGLGGAVLGGQVGSLFGRTMENPGGYGTYGAILGGLGWVIVTMEQEMLAQVEQVMAQLIQEKAPEDVREFINAMAEDGVTQGEVSEFREETVMAINNPNYFDEYLRYLTVAGFMEKTDVPSSYDVNFLFSMLGLGAIAQDVIDSQSQGQI